MRQMVLEKQPREKRGKMTIEDRLNFFELKANKKTMKEFVLFLRANKRSNDRIFKYCWMLRNVEKLLGKDFNKADKKDIEHLVANIEDSPYTPWTKHDYKAAIKTFYKWLKSEDNDESPREVRWIKTGVKERTTVTPSDILTKEEADNMISAANNLRTKAMLGILFETGIRVGELMSMRIKDVAIDEHMISLFVTGKTGRRTVFVKGYRQHIVNWLNSHPFKNDRESYVWVENNGKAVNKPISHNRICDTIKRAAVKSGMDATKAKKIHPHLFRHSAATRIAKQLTEQEMKVYFGWTPGSNMAAVYCHLSAEDIKNAVLGKVYDVEKAKMNNSNDKVKSKICEACGRDNPSDARFCNCGSVLDIKTAIEIDAKLKDAKYVENQFSGDVLKMFAQLRDLEKRLKVMNNQK